jgi:hypothetical protein
MQTLGRDHFKSITGSTSKSGSSKPGCSRQGSSKPGSGTVTKALVLPFMAVALTVLQGCGGTSTPNYPDATVNNPGSGVTLQAIKITPPTSLISLAENRQLVAIGVYSDGTSADVSSQVAWTASSAPSTTSNVAVSSKGLATGMAIGLSVITATAGNVTGAIQLTVDTNGYTSGTTAVLSVPYKSTVVDAAYLPQSLNTIQGAYAVQEVNLDADSFSNVLPVPVALLASIPMPKGFVPNVTVANQSNALVAVISYASPNVQIIDASNIPTDLNDNLVVNTFTAPVSQSITINGITCMICAAVVNPLTNQLVLSTAQGFYTLDMVKGTFTAIPFSPAPALTANFSINPAGVSPYILSASAFTGEVQVLDLTTNAVTTANSGLTAPSAASINLLINYASIIDGDALNQSIVDLSNPQSPQFSVAPNLGVCAGSPSLLNMEAVTVSPSATVNNAIQSLLITQTSGDCVGVQLWPLVGAVTGELQPSDILYGYGTMPTTPDGSQFLNGSDPNTIATFNDVLSGSHTSFGVLVDANQQWVARVNLGAALSGSNIAVGNGDTPLPAGQPFSVPPGLCTGGNFCPAPSVLYLPTPSTAVTVSVPSISFGSVSVGTATPAISVIEANIGTSELNNQISVQGANASDFSLFYTCGLTILPHSNCSIGVAFTPSATGARAATLSITVSGAANPLTVALAGTGT